MEKLPLPEKHKVIKIGDNQADIIIEPCYPGYGTTLGNALRRVLLSSLSGAAITTVKIKGVTHEFSTLPGIKEDIVEILLNLKRIRFKLHATDETKVTLKVKGEKNVKAKDIKLTSEVEVINSDAEIATLSDKNAELEMEFTIKSGRGYLPVENIEKKKLILGNIAIDAIFTPVKNVNFHIQNVRVGQMTNYDKLTLSITTDGSITPEESLKQAAQILLDHFQQLSILEEENKEMPSEIATKKEKDEKKDENKNDIKEEAPKIKKKRGRPKKQ
ncbi:DNA-directed RNA polymerase subunit alpha [Patescibacteria group bacterium]|nr:DNA-directed RNA polymerase subunit alpha [Patescibacteria group bacterium]MBU0963640.1 DNA-directed RNA polymerase subunit alpha [Patescibacteria group bacterium]